MRFVIARPAVHEDADADACSPDTLLFPLRDVRRHRYGKLLLQHAWLRFAAGTQHAVNFIGRADDDALFNSSAIAADLAATAALHAEYIALGPFRNWYQMEGFKAECWSNSPAEYLHIRRRYMKANASRELSPHPCYTSRVVGPFPFAGGPLLVLSRSLVLLIGEALLDDERQLAAMPDSELFQVARGANTSGRVARRAPFYKMEDVLLFKHIFLACQHRPVTLVGVSIHELIRSLKAGGSSCARGGNGSFLRLDFCADVYHALRRPSDYEWVHTQSRLQPAGTVLHPPRTRLVCDAPGVVGKSMGEVLSAVHGCCGGWRMCYFVLPNSSHFPPPTGWWDFNAKLRLKWVAP